MKNKLIILFIAVSLGIASHFLSGAIALFAVFGAVAYFIYKNADPEDRRFILALLVSGFLLRVIVALTLHASSYVHGYGGSTSGDDLLYTIRGWAVVYQWEGKPYTWAKGLIGSSEYGLNPFTFILAFFYKIYGFHPATAKIINCIIGTLLGWLSYLIARELFDKNTARISMSIVTFYPSLLRWSVANLKDPLTILLFMLCIYISITILHRNDPVWKFGILFSAILMLYYFPQRFYLILAVVSVANAVFLRVFYFLSRKGMRALLVVLIGISALGCAYYFFCINPKHLIEFLYRCEAQQAVIAKADYAGYYLYARDFLESLNKGMIDIRGLVYELFVNTVYFMLTPFPWQMSSRSRLIAAPQMFLWYTLLILSFFGFFKLLVKRPAAAFLLGTLLIIGITVNALAEGNIGSAFRHRDIFVPFLAILASNMIAGLTSKRTLLPSDLKVTEME